MKNVVLICFFALSAFESLYSQPMVICVPHYDIIKISTKDTSVINWTYPRRPSTEYHVSIRSLFDDELKTFNTRDTFLVIGPGLAPNEENLLIRISPTSHLADENDIVLTRKVFKNEFADSIFDEASCDRRIMKLLENEMYPTALYTYHQYKEKFQLTATAEFFKQINAHYYDRTDFMIVFKKGRAIVKNGSLRGAVHRD